MFLSLRARAKACASIGFPLVLGAIGSPAPVSAAMTPTLTSAVDCLAAAVYYEARGESPAGQAAVAQVVLNRERKAGFPKSVCGVIYQSVQGHGCQFSFVCSGAMSRPREPSAWDRARNVAARALAGYVMSAIGEATSFHAVRLGSGPDRHMSRIAQVGGHVFLVSASAAARPVTRSEPS